MKINFKRVTARNFLSYGNKPTTLQLDDNPFTIIHGENGAGKTTLTIDLIGWILKGKIQRKGIITSQVVNNINGKNCYGSLEFSIGKKEYKVVRGIKPNILELWIDGINQESESSKKLMQQEIDNIIKIDLPTLSSICLMSINSTTPFVDLSPEQTRQITEDILGISIFSDMLKDIKKQIKDNKDSLKINTKDLNLFSELVNEGKEKLAKYKELKENFNEEKKKKIKTFAQEKDEKEDKRKNYKQDRQKLIDSVDEEDLQNSLNEYGEKIKDLQEVINDLNSTIKAEKALIIIEKEKIETLSKNDPICPTCSSELTDEHKEIEINKSTQIIHNYEESHHRDNESIDKLIKDIDKLQNNITQIHNDEQEYHQNLRSLDDNINSLDRDIQHIDNNLKNLEKENIEDKLKDLVNKSKIKEHVNKFKLLKSENIKLKEKSKYLELIKNILSDGGVKSEIIKKDIPYLNSLIIKYMNLFGKSFSIQFKNDFSIEMKGHQKKGLGYYNLSSGEKKRIDLAILFSFIELIKKKNSVSTNLLVFDELLNTSLDNDGTDIILNILNVLTKDEKIDNIFIITHDKNLNLSNARTIEIKKKDNFSQIEYLGE